MKIELAKSAGFCFGVKRAVDTVYDVLKEKKEGPDFIPLAPSFIMNRLCLNWKTGRYGCGWN